jgi:hypothetical protein
MNPPLIGFKLSIFQILSLFQSVMNAIRVERELQMLESGVEMEEAKFPVVRARLSAPIDPLTDIKERLLFKVVASSRRGSHKK